MNAKKHETPEERLRHERDALRAEIREAHEALKDLGAATKEARRLIPELVGERLVAEVSTQLAAFHETTREAMDASVLKVVKEFDDLAAILKGETSEDRRKGRRSIPELVQMVQAIDREET